MWEYLKSLRASGTTILLTTHYLEEAEQLCRHVAIIHKGEIIAAGTVKEILARLKDETVVLDLAGPLAEAALALLPEFQARAVDATTIEIQIGEGRLLGDAVVALAQSGIPVHTARPKSGRLEEVFLRLTGQAGNGGRAS
jgi:ABC-2 type transport system ATP-binding protein